MNELDLNWHLTVWVGNEIHFIQTCGNIMEIVLEMVHVVMAAQPLRGFCIGRSTKTAQVASRHSQ